MDKNGGFNIGKDETLCVRYNNEHGVTSHILCRKSNADPNKMWILWSVEQDGSLKKVAHGSNPLKLENQISYIKEARDT